MSRKIIFSLNHVLKGKLAREGMKPVFKSSVDKKWKPIPNCLEFVINFHDPYQIFRLIQMKTCYKFHLNLYSILELENIGLLTAIPSNSY